MKTALVTLALLAALLAAPPAAADPGDCNGDYDAACYYDDDGDPATTDQLCVVWAPNIATRSCLVGG